MSRCSILRKLLLRRRIINISRSQFLIVIVYSCLNTSPGNEWINQIVINTFYEYCDAMSAATVISLLPLHTVDMGHACAPNRDHNAWVRTSPWFYDCDLPILGAQIVFWLRDTSSRGNFTLLHWLTNLSTWCWIIWRRKLRHGLWFYAAISTFNWKLFYNLLAGSTHSFHSWERLFVPIIPFSFKMFFGSFLINLPK